WLMKPFGPTGEAAAHMAQTVDAPVTTASFAPFGPNYRGGLSLAVGWLAGSLGGAQSIVVGQRAGGTVKIYSSGSALQGAPMVYLKNPEDHDYGVGFTATASFDPFGGRTVSVGTTATTSGADLLVGGISPDGKTVRLMKYAMVRATPTAATLRARPLGRISSTPGSQAPSIGGN